MPIWEIYTYGSGAFLATIFNGVVALMGANDFVTLMRLAGIFGLMWVTIKAALYKGPVEWTYLIWFVMIYGVLFVPKVDVVIVDRLDNNQTRVVANVPWGLGVFAGVTSRIGDWFTRGTEAVTSLPDDLRYQRNGVVFGSTLVEAASRFEITDGRFMANMSEFMRQCVFYDILLRRYTWTDLLEAEDTWEFIRDNTSPISRAFAYTAADGTRTILTCRNGAQNQLSNDWETEIDRASRLYGVRFNPGLTMSDAAAKLLADLPVSYDYLAGISRAGGDIIRANMMANLFRRAFGSAAAEANADAAAQDFALAQAEQQQYTTYAVMGKLAAKLLPLLKSIYEGLLYGMFPFLFLVFMLPIGVKIFLAYLKNIVWLQLWAPLYAILNLLMTLYAQGSSTAAAAQLGGQALSLATHSGLATANADVAIIAGYMGLSIPLIAYGLVSGGQMALSQLAAQIGAVAQVAANQASASASTGNINLANIGAYKTGMFQNVTSPTMDFGRARTFDEHGGAITHTLGGRAVRQQFHQDLGVDAVSTESLVTSTQHQLANARSAEARAEKTFNEELGAAFTRSMGMTREQQIQALRASGWSEDEAAQWAETSSRMKEISKQLQQEHGFTKEQADRITYLASAGVSWSAKDMALIGAALKPTGLDINARATREGAHSETDRVMEAFKEAQAAAEKHQITDSVESLKRYVSGDEYRTQQAGRAAFDSGLGADLRDAARAGQAWAAAERETTAYQQTLSTLRTQGENFRAGLVDRFAADAQAAGLFDHDLLRNPARSRELADAIVRWSALTRNSAVEGPEAARMAIAHAERGGSFGGPDSGVTSRVLGGREAVDQAAGEYRSRVSGEGAVRQQAAHNRGAVATNARGTGLGNDGTVENDAGVPGTPLTTRQDVREFQTRVESHIEGKAPWEVNRDRRDMDKDHHDRQTEVDGQIEKGRRETEGLTPTWMKKD